MGMAEKNFNKLLSFGLNKYLIETDPEVNEFTYNLMKRHLEILIND